MSRGRMRLAGISVVLAIVVGTAYFLTTARSVGFIDSGELASVAWTLGIAHPTGYPLFTLLGWMAAHLPLGIAVIFRLNLFSAATSVAAVVLLFHFLLWCLRNLRDAGAGVRPPGDRTRPGEKTGPPLGRIELIISALFGALTLAFSATFWSQATAVEVYPLHTLFLVLLIFLFLRTFLPSGRARAGARSLPEQDEPAGNAVLNGLLFAYLLGLSFTNHMTTLYLAPAFLFYYFRTRGVGPSSRSFLYRLVPAFLLGCSLYIYLPVRAAAGAIVNWGDPTTVGAILRHLSGKQYSVWIFSSAETAGRQLRYFLSTYGEEFWYLPVLLAIIGLRFLYRTNRDLFAFFLLLFAGCLAFAVNYDIHDIDSYFLLAYLATAVLAAVGLHGLLGMLKKKNLRLATAVLALAFTGGQAVRTAAEADQSDLKIVEAYTRSILDATAPGAMVISYQWDYFISASYYYQVVEGYRPDVVIIDKELLRRSWYFTFLERRYPGIVSRSRETVDLYLRELYKFENDLPYDARIIEERYRRLIEGFITKQYNLAPVYVTAEIEPGYTQGYRRVPHGLTFRLVGPGDEEKWEEVTLDLERPAPRSRLLDGITMMHARAEMNSAIYLANAGRIDEARQHARRAVEIRSDSPETRALLGRLENTFVP